jgi:exodeoxyribonuclease VII large subunit
LLPGESKSLFITTPTDFFALPEIVNDKKVFSLAEVAGSIKQTLSKRYTTAFWVKAEMIKLNHYKHSGHCYPDLADKAGHKIVAQMRALLWQSDYLRINATFLKLLNEPLKDGIKILFLASITFDAVHGLSLRIIDIDAAFTLGDLEKEKLDTIQKMKAQGLYDKNRNLPLPLLPQRIAIISVETGKGYADFIRVIENNDFGYRFFHMLFPSLLQGEKAVDGIVGQLERIRRVMHHFDVVAIVRGGGSDVGLSCYNNYLMARAIAQFPLPVLTGIGHSTNETVAEMVASENAITPTKLAELLIQQFHNFATPLENARKIIVQFATDTIQNNRRQLTSEVKLFRSATQNILGKNRHTLITDATALGNTTRKLFIHEQSAVGHIRLKITSLTEVSIKTGKQSLTGSIQKMATAQKSFFKNEALKFGALQKNFEILHPNNVLKRGYSITFSKGKTLHSVEDVHQGDTIETLLPDGKIISIVDQKEKEN